jgi:hypothetical protein
MTHRLGGLAEHGREAEVDDRRGSLCCGPHGATGAGGTGTGAARCETAVGAVSVGDYDDSGAVTDADSINAATRARAGAAGARAGAGGDGHRDEGLAT